MSWFRRSAVIIGGAAIASFALLPSAPALPNRDIRVIVPSADGSVTDLIAWILHPRMSAFLGERILVQNRRGAVATPIPGPLSDDCATSTLLLQNSASVISPLLSPEAKSFGSTLVPVEVVAEAPLVLAVSSQTGAGDLPGYLQLARMTGQPALVRVVGTGSVADLIGLLLSRAADAQMECLSYSNDQGLLQDLAGGRLPAGIIPANSAVMLADAGRIRPVAITAAKRYSTLPGVPTFRKVGLEEADMANWYALFAGTETVSFTRHHLETAIRYATDDREVRRQMLLLGAQPLIVDASFFRRRIEAQQHVLQGVMTQAGLSPA